MSHSVSFNPAQSHVDAAQGNILMLDKALNQQQQDGKAAVRLIDTAAQVQRSSRPGRPGQAVDTYA